MLILVRGSQPNTVLVYDLLQKSNILKKIVLTISLEKKSKIAHTLVEQISIDIECLNF